MNCRDIFDLIDEYLENSISSVQISEFETHISVCNNCFIFISTYRKTISLSRETITRNIPETIDTRITMRLKNEIRFLRHEIKKPDRVK